MEIRMGPSSWIQQLDYETLRSDVEFAMNTDIPDLSPLPEMFLDLLRGTRGRFLHLLYLRIMRALHRLNLKTKAKGRRELGWIDTVMVLLTGLRFLMIWFKRKVFQSSFLLGIRVCMKFWKKRERRRISCYLQSTFRVYKLIWTHLFRLRIPGSPRGHMLL
jgi:hypothetical protein